MRVNPRPGRFLKSYVDPRKLPKRVKAMTKEGVAAMAAGMPHLDVSDAIFEFSPASAKVQGPNLSLNVGEPAKCDFDEPTEEVDAAAVGVPEGDKLMEWFSYRQWAKITNPAYDGNMAYHFDVMLGLLISMANDKDNKEFPDTEAFPCVQFLRTIKTPEGDVPPNCMAFISYIQYVCQKMLDEG
ncbi:uncharacterized protein LOC111062612 isoform X2 [Nilaparvata lugens]|nr:uncharacterized protein LOC111062612 isoform X2 [Nilaparvata lugens]